VRTGTEQRLAAEVRRLRFALRRIEETCPGEACAIASRALHMNKAYRHRLTWDEAELMARKVAALRTGTEMTQEAIALELGISRARVDYYIRRGSRKGYSLAAAAK
jgi:DNA-binding transcriptional regulator YiaG